MVGTHSPDVTSRSVCDTRQRSLFQDALVQVINHLIRNADIRSCDADRIHSIALEGLIHALLGTESREIAPILTAKSSGGLIPLAAGTLPLFEQRRAVETSFRGFPPAVESTVCPGGASGNHDMSAAFQAIKEKGLGPFTPEQVGHLYEFGRGFRPEIASGGKVTLLCSAIGKRNQGLFYTPQLIVRHIVNAALDAFPLSDRTDYLNLKLLDPAVGTGTFLLYALEELTGRVLKAWAKAEDPIGASIARMRAYLRERARQQGIPCDPDEETAIRVHIMSTCLYGVDLDPLAVHIAKIALQKRAFKEFPWIPGIEPHIRVGNALIGSPSGTCTVREAHESDESHARAYFGAKQFSRDSIHEWVEEKRVFHWAHGFPEIFSQTPGGFDCVIGNPPYEIVSVKESGIHDRKLEQKYFRATYRTCHGKVNTYRLMMERGVTLLRDGGVLGFIVPATLLADSTAEKLRKLILQETRIVEALVIPETAQAFEGVTQAFLVLVCRKGERTVTLAPALWDGASPIPGESHVAIDTDLIERIGYRIPLLTTPREKALLDVLIEHPPLAGSGHVPAVGRVHQGEMNLTVDRVFMTASPTDYPLIRGEHVMPLRVSHPSRQEGRLDWIVPSFFEKEVSIRSNPRKCDSDARLCRPPRPWEQSRIVLGRVVNMETKRRLKAAAVAPGQFLGDMTNFIASPGLPQTYLLGLLNSRLLNWRIKLTSTNNYLSAAEVEMLPVPRPDMALVSRDAVARARQDLSALLAASERSLQDWIDQIKRAVHATSPHVAQALVAHMVSWIGEEILDDPEESLQGREPDGNRWNALDAAVLLLYECESYVDVLL